MLQEDDLIEIDGWERDHFGDYICEWFYELDADEGSKKWDGLAITVQEQGPNEYTVSVAVALDDGVGDLLSADYSDSCRTVEEAMAIVREFVDELNEEHLN